MYCCNWFKHISRHKLNQECNSIWSAYVYKYYSKLYIYGNNMLEQSSRDRNWRVCNYTNAPLTNRPQRRRAKVSSITDARTPDFQICGVCLCVLKLSISCRQSLSKGLLSPTFSVSTFGFAFKDVTNRKVVFINLKVNISCVLGKYFKFVLATGRLRGRKYL